MAQVIGGCFALTLSGSALLGSSALIVASMLVLPAVHAWPTDRDRQAERAERAAAGASSLTMLVMLRNTLHEKHLAHLMVSALFVYGEAAHSYAETFGSAEEDGLSQFGHIFAGSAGVLVYVTVRSLSLSLCLCVCLSLTVCVTAVHAELRLPQGTRRG